MWKYVTSYEKIRVIALLLLLLLFFVSSAHGSSMTTKETPEYMTARMELWNALNQELDQQAIELVTASNELKRLKKPSAELLKELNEAKILLQKSQEDLKIAKDDLTLASKELDELKISCKTLRQNIDKERRVHRRQVWQNRFWFFVGGVAVALAAK